MKIIEENEQSLDELVVRARSDSRLREIMSNTITGIEGMVYFSQGRDVYVIEGKKSPRRVFTAPSEITCIAKWNGYLYCVFYEKVFNVFENKTLTAGYVGRPFIYGDLIHCYIAGMYDRQTGVKKYKIANNKMNYNGFHSTSTKHDIISMCSGLNTRSEYVALFGLDNREVWDLTERRLFFTAGEKVQAMCSPWVGKFYYAQGKNILDHLHDVVAERPSPVKSMCDHAGVMYDAGDYGIYETLSNKLLIRASAHCITDGGFK
jgi:hypothetical protein